ncbi:proteasome-activating nucleotidase [Fervidicoccus fontis]|uniref:Proteasome-activating nucleotidase n=2 Tax=Fervidicoccus fontis TaxID=683846 RepID=I0A1F6_FERFK|nr:proteasome-activating nucleotidase [Fervidicoccus fontis]AFH42813.1 proteasome-activating nucleotidase [Fervidicoccus fontis Kam940]MBE9391599.1 proteasome-activating nucleotidase [Fervidicoccus fontis]PMB76300.1 MAG: ATP-dependent zinc metalloprotease FtsH [Fervidicoccus fontis]HEW63783.1 AAA family ATPase [Fervidicoccus fontis]
MESADDISNANSTNVLAHIKYLEEKLKVLEEEKARLEKDINSYKEEKEKYIKYLEEKIKELEEEKLMLNREVKYYKEEMEKLLAPPLIEASVLDILPDKRVVVRSSTGPNLIVTVSGNISVDQLLPGTIVAINQRGSSIVEVLPQREDPYVKAMEVIERPNVKYKDIGGLSKQIQEVRETVELPLKKPELFKKIGIEPPKGILLYGSPGTGKTMLAKAVASETNATFIRVVGSEFVQKFIGEGARIVREVFELAKRKAPAIIFIDEIDAIAARRIDIGTSGEREVQRTMMQLLAEMDGFDPLDNVKVIAATNRIDILDPAILRPGRFDRIIEVPLPDKQGRIEIFKIHIKKMNVEKNLDIRKLSELTEGFVGADIKAVCVEAGYNAIREERDLVTMEDFIKAIEKIKGRKKEVEPEVPQVSTAY